MPKFLPALVAFILTAHRLFAAADASDRSTATQLQVRIDRREHEIATMRAYSVRLRRMLAEAGYPAEQLLRELSFEQKLARTLPRVRCEKMRFSGAISALSRLAQVQIVVDWKTLADAGINSDAPITCDVRDGIAQSILQTMLENAGGADNLQYYIENGKVFVTTWEQASKRVYTRAYDIAGALPRSPAYQSLLTSRDLLARIVTNTVAPDSWQDAGGTVGSLSINGHTMTVTQTAENLKAVENLLDELDESKRIPHRQSIINQQEIQIVALGVTIDKLIARCRSLGIRVPPRLDQAMDRVIPDMQFIGTPLTKCVESLQIVSGQKIDVDWEVMKSAGIDSRMPITLSLNHQTLAGSLQLLIGRASEGNAPLQYVAEDNTIYISTQQDFDKATVTRIYDIRDVPSQGNTREEAVDYLIHAITTTIEPDSWRDAGGSVGAIRELQGQLIVTHCERVQAHIKAYIDALRKLGKIP